MCTRARLLSFLAAAMVALSTVSHAQRGIVDTWHIGGEGQWDYVTVDSATHRVFITRGTHTQVLDGATGKLLGDITGQTRAHGVALAPAANRGFISDGGGTGSIVIFDLRTYAVLGRIAALPDADGIIFDPALNRVLAASGDSNALISLPADVDLATGKIDPPIALGGSPEFLASDGSGKVYVNLQDKDVVAEVDLKTRRVIARWPVAPGGSPTGLSIDPVHHHLFIGCRKPQMLVVMSTVDGSILASLPIGAGVDATAFDNGLALASTRDGFLTVVAEKSGRFAVQQVVKTLPGARTMNVDTATHRIFLPAAIYEDAPATSPGTAAGRPKARPDSFRVLVVDQVRPR